MRRRSFALEIFGVSALDLFASALGAFIVVTVILFPYYQRQAEFHAERGRLEAELVRLNAENSRLMRDEPRLRAETDRLRRQVEQQLRMASLAREAARLQRENAELERRIENMERRQNVNFLIVRIGWQRSADVDLHVVDPEGREISFSRRNVNRRHYPDTPAELTLDRRTGPGVEVYLNPQVMPGDYKVYYNLYDYPLFAPRGPVEVTGIVVYRNGRHDLPARTLTSISRAPMAGNPEPVATVTVRRDGSVWVH
jgi:hypothetical protein